MQTHDLKYRISKLTFGDRVEYEVQKQIWRQVPKSHRFNTVEEAKARIAYLKGIKTRGQTIIHEE